MPWDCKSCNTPAIIDDETTCPECGASKASWTMVSNQTRTMTVRRGKKFTLHRSAEPGEPLPPDGSYDDVEVIKAESAPAIPKAAALKLHEDGLLPAPGQLLFARLLPRKHKDLCVDAIVHYAMDEVGQLGFPYEGEPQLREDGTLDVRFLCVYGPDPLPDEVAFTGVHVIDVTEESDLGFAPTLGIAALGIPGRPGACES